MPVHEQDLEQSLPQLNESDSSSSIRSNNTVVEDDNFDTAEQEKTEQKMDILSNPYFSAFLLIIAGCALAIQAGLKDEIIYLLYLSFTDKFVDRCQRQSK
jgi:hypothetical protein